jgi:hypothetical protein
MAEYYTSSWAAKSPPLLVVSINSMPSGDFDHNDHPALVYKKSYAS